MDSLMKKLFINISGALLSTVIFLSILELGSRLYVQVKHRLNEYEALIEEQGFTPQNKKTGEKRVFIVGESAARGVPYTMDSSLSGFLHQLVNTTGSTKLKIINTGMPGRHSFYQREEAKTLIKYKADVVLIYAGNNDTRDFSNVMRDVPFALIDFKLTWNSSFYWIFKRKILSLKRWINKIAQKQIFPINFNQDDVWHWTDTYLQKKRAYLEDAELGLKRKERALKDFEYNISDLVQMLKNHGIQVLICGLPIVYEWPPTISDWSRKGYVFEQKVNFKSKDEEMRWGNIFEKIPQTMERGNFKGTLDLLEKAEKIDTTYPLLQFYFGKAYAGRGNYSEAKKRYTLAKDLQIQSLGGDSFKSKILRDIAIRYRIPFIDLQKPLEEMSPNEMIGTNLFLDHCHPNLLGHKIITAKILEAFCKHQLTLCEDSRSKWKYWLQKLIGSEINETNLAREYLLIAFYKFKGTPWEQEPRYEEAIQYLEKAREITPNNKDIYPMLAASYWKTGKKSNAKASLDILWKLNQKEYEHTFKDFPYLLEAKIA